MERLLNLFSGTWSVSEKYEPSEWAPKGGIGQGQVTWRRGPGGLSLIEDYHSTNPGGETIGLSVTWWDENEQGFRALWCVNRNPRGCTVMSKLAKWEGKKLVLGDEFERNGKKVAFKEVVSPVSSTS